MKNNQSIHLQNFPDISFIDNEEELVKDMDMVRQVCSAALFVRDQKNLRVRLPLNQLKIIGKNAYKMLRYREIIADEVNVKNLIIVEEIGDFAQLKLQINFKKVALRLSRKIKEITVDARENNWQKIADNQIAIAGEILTDDEFEIKLITKNQDNIAVLASNDCLVELDLNVSRELEEEGLARDVVRAIQQNRKEANLDVAQQIEIMVNSNDILLLKVIENHQNYIKEQTLAKEILIGDLSNSNQQYSYNFDHKIDQYQLLIKIRIATI